MKRLIALRFGFALSGDMFSRSHSWSREGWARGETLSDRPDRGPPGLVVTGSTLSQRLLPPLPALLSALITVTRLEFPLELRGRQTASICVYDGLARRCCRCCWWWCCVARPTSELAANKQLEPPAYPAAGSSRLLVMLLVIFEQQKNVIEGVPGCRVFQTIQSDWSVALQGSASVCVPARPTFLRRLCVWEIKFTIVNKTITRFLSPA